MSSLLEQLRTGCDDLMSDGLEEQGLLLDKAITHIQQLETENEALRKDAERYRWLIDQHWIQSEVDWRLIPTQQESTIKQLGEAIDAARDVK